jgi:hypothetical protein
MSFSCSSHACGSFWLQKCLRTASDVASSCGPVATHPRTGKSARDPNSAELSRTSHLRP